MVYRYYVIFCFRGKGFLVLWCFSFHCFDFGFLIFTGAFRKVRRPFGYKWDPGRRFRDSWPGEKDGREGRD